MKESKFQFSDPKLDNFEFYVNKDFNKEQYDGIKISNHVQADALGECDAIVKLDLFIGEKNNSVPFYIHISNHANFHCDDVQLFNKLIKTNAPALLLSYLRPIVSFLVVQSGYNNFNIPFMDFSDNNIQ